MTIGRSQGRIGVFAGPRESFPSHWMFPQALRTSVFAVYRPHRLSVHRLAPGVTKSVPHTLFIDPFAYLRVKYPRSS